MDEHLCTVNQCDNEQYGRQLAAKVETWIAQHRDELLQDIFTAVSVPSISGKPDGDLPYGKGCGQMIDVLSSMVTAAGFTLENHGYHFGTTQLDGTGNDTIGIFSHVDVVPVGDDWSFDPFRPFLKDGYIYGRGSTDDKGPAIAALYVLKCLRDLKVPLKHNVMLYFGCDEESSMGDIHHYLAECTPPKLSLVPDSRFSVCCGEKGIVNARITFDLAGTGIERVHAGSAENIVPNFAQMTVVCSEAEASKMAACQELSVQYGDGKAVVSAEGIASHAAFPENSVNALDKLSNALKDISFAGAASCGIINGLAALSLGYLGQGIGIDAQDDFFGPLTAVSGTARTEGTTLTVTLNIRYPVATSGEKIRQQLTQFCTEHGAVLESFRDDGPAYFSPNDPIPVLLNDLCKEVLQADFAPYSMGGGTYARHLPNAMACGPLNKHLNRPGGTKRGGGHQPDECVCFESLENMIKIYVRAIAKIDAMI